MCGCPVVRVASTTWFINAYAPAAHPSHGAHPCFQSLAKTIRPFTHPCMHPFTHPSIHGSMDKSSHPSIQPSDHSAIQPSSHPPIAPPTRHPSIHEIIAPGTQPTRRGTLWTVRLCVAGRLCCDSASLQPVSSQCRRQFLLTSRVAASSLSLSLVSPIPPSIPLPPRTPPSDHPCIDTSTRRSQQGTPPPTEEAIDPSFRSSISMHLHSCSGMSAIRPTAILPDPLVSLRVLA